MINQLRHSSSRCFARPQPPLCEISQSITNHYWQAIRLPWLPNGVTHFMYLPELLYTTWHGRQSAFQVVLYIDRALIMIITVPADGLAPNGARPSAGTVLTIKLDVSSYTFLWLWLFQMTFYQADDIVQNARQILQKPHVSLSINSLWPSDTKWRHRYGSTLAQVMACCLTAPSHYLNQCWLIISEVL